MISFSAYTLQGQRWNYPELLHFSRSFIINSISEPSSLASYQSLEIKEPSPIIKPVPIRITPHLVRPTPPTDRIHKGYNLQMDGLDREKEYQANLY